MINGLTRGSSIFPIQMLTQHTAIPLLISAAALLSSLRAAAQLAAAGLDKHSFT